MSIYVNAFLYQVQALYILVLFKYTAANWTAKGTWTNWHLGTSGEQQSIRQPLHDGQCLEVPWVLERLERLDPLEHDSDFWWLLVTSAGPAPDPEVILLNAILISFMPLGLSDLPLAVNELRELVNLLSFVDVRFIPLMCDLSPDVIQILPYIAILHRRLVRLSSVLRSDQEMKHPGHWVPKLSCRATILIQLVLAGAPTPYALMM